MVALKDNLSFFFGGQLSLGYGSLFKVGFIRIRKIGYRVHILYPETIKYYIAQTSKKYVNEKHILKMLWVSRVTFITTCKSFSNY